MDFGAVWLELCTRDLLTGELALTFFGSGLSKPASPCQYDSGHAETPNPLPRGFEHVVMLDVKLWGRESRFQTEDESNAACVRWGNTEVQADSRTGHPSCEGLSLLDICVSHKWRATEHMVVVYFGIYCGTSEHLVGGTVLFVPL
jgi:hypothetical protein